VLRRFDDRRRRYGETLVVEALPGGFEVSEWSPDGQWLLGVRTSPEDGDVDIWQVEPDGQNLTQVLDRPGHQLDPTYSPDGAAITFEDWQSNEGSDIFVVAADGLGTVTNLTNAPGKDYYPAGPRADTDRVHSCREGARLRIMDADGRRAHRSDPLDTAELHAYSGSRQVVISARTSKVGDAFQLHIQIPSAGTGDPLVSTNGGRGPNRGTAGAPSRSTLPDGGALRA
jgi:hypothetical protein